VYRVNSSFETLVTQKTGDPRAIAPNLGRLDRLHHARRLL